MNEECMSRAANIYHHVSGFLFVYFFWRRRKDEKFEAVKKSEVRFPPPGLSNDTANSIFDKMLG